MPYFSSFLSGLFQDKIPNDERKLRLKRRAYQRFVAALYKINLDIFRAFDLPPWQQTLVTVEPSLDLPCAAVPSDVWLDALSVLKNDSGSVRDLACYRAAYNAVRGGDHQSPSPFSFGQADDLKPMNTFVSGLFNGPNGHNGLDVALSKRVIGHYLDALFQNDVDIFKTYKMPDLYRSGVRYKSMAPPCEELPGDVWLDAPMLLATKMGDCKDLSCYLAAQRTVYEGRPCRPATQPPKFDGDFSLYHIVVLYNDGSVEDPSLKLGMKPIG